MIIAIGLLISILMCGCQSNFISCIILVLGILLMLYNFKAEIAFFYHPQAFKIFSTELLM